MNNDSKKYFLVSNGVDYFHGLGFHREQNPYMFDTMQRAAQIAKSHLQDVSKIEIKEIDMLKNSKTVKTISCIEED